MNIRPASKKLERALTVERREARAAGAKTAETLAGQRGPVGAGPSQVSGV